MKRPIYIENDITLYHDDCLAVMKALHQNSIDAIVTDPPYGLTQNKKGGTGEKSLNLNSPAGRSRITTGVGFMGMQWDHGVPGIEYWTEALRVAKPGAYLLAFGGTRTYHRLTCAIEDAGWEIRDCLMWVFGSGFPKSLDVSKAIDRAAGVKRHIVGPNIFQGINGKENITCYGKASRQPETDSMTDDAKHWNGFGTALKPAYEPILLARKPLEGTVAQNILKWGTGAMNIDACRIEAEQWNRSTLTKHDIRGGRLHAGTTDRLIESDPQQGHSLGRWPANLLLDGSDEVLACFPDAPGQIADANTQGERKFGNCYSPMKYGRTGEPSDGSENEGEVGFKMKPGARRLDGGSAARFFYTAKASASDRGHEEWDALPLFEEPAGQFKNTHPTVKPLALMRYLLTLVSREGARILDPFLGSGTTAVAAKQLGRQCIGIEQEESSCTIAVRRVASVKGVLL